MHYVRRSNLRLIRIPNIRGAIMVDEKKVRLAGMAKIIERFNVLEIFKEKKGDVYAIQALFEEQGTPTSIRVVRKIKKLIDGGKIGGDKDAPPSPLDEKTKALIEKTEDMVAQTKGMVSKIDAVIESKVKEKVDSLVKKLPLVEFTVNDIKRRKVKKIKATLPAEFKKMVALAQARRHIYLVGPAGCGKTYLAGKLAEVLALDFASISCSLGMSESQLAGWLVPTGKGGQFEYRRSPFVKAYEEGGVFLMDEIDSADPNTLTFMNSALANKQFSIPNRPNEVAVRHPDFVFIACANTFGNGADRMYVGRNQLDTATLDRFRIGTIEMDYDDGVEKSLVREDILTWGRKVRSTVNRAGLRRVVSTRFLQDLSIMAGSAPDYYGKPKDWVATLTSGWSEDEVRNISQL